MTESDENGKSRFTAACPATRNRVKTSFPEGSVDFVKRWSILYGSIGAKKSSTGGFLGEIGVSFGWGQPGVAGGSQF